MDRTLSLRYGPHPLGRYDERGGPILNPKLAVRQPAVEKTPRRLREIRKHVEN